MSKTKAAYDFDKQIAAINLLTKNNQLQENAIEKQNIIIAATAILLLLIISMSFYMYRSLKIKKRDNQLLKSQKDQIAKQSEQLSEKNKTIESINKNLEIEVDKRTRKLKQVNNELDTFLYRASHDIRQPISTILGLEHLARKFIHDEDMETILEKLNNTANGMDLMLSKLQMIYHLNHTKDVSMPVDIKIVADGILSLYHDAIQRKGIEVNNMLPHFKINTLPDLLNIIFRNLIENAIYFSQPGQPAFVKLYTSQDEAQLTIYIEDNGYGIEEEFQKQIFQAYFKGNEHSKGNGLGLYITQKAAQTLGLSIKVESTLNKGSKFSISIPFNTKNSKVDVMTEIPTNQ